MITHECSCPPLQQLVALAAGERSVPHCPRHRPLTAEDRDAALNDDDQLLGSLKAALNIPLEDKEPPSWT